MRWGKWMIAAMLCVAGLAPALAQGPACAPVGPRPGESPRFSIGLIADAQYCDCDADKDRFYRISLDKLQQAVDTFNARGVDMAMNLGDLIDQELGNYHRPLAILGGLRMPLMHVLGNHEFWSVPFHAQGSVLDTLGLPQGYCDHRLPGWRLLLLDGTELAGYAAGAHRELAVEAALCEGSLQGHGNAAIWNGALGAAQMAWLDTQLSESDRAGERVLLFCHFPIHPPGHPMSLWNEADLRVLLRRHPSAVAWIAGHSHTSLYAVEGGLHHLTLEGMLMSPDSNAFAILNVYDDRLVVEGFGREPYRVLPLAGSAATADTIEPVPGVEADAVPEAEPQCVVQTVVDWRGEVVRGQVTEAGTEVNGGGLPPGCYGVWEAGENGRSYGRLVVLPAAEPQGAEGRKRGWMSRSLGSRRR